MLMFESEKTGYNLYIRFRFLLRGCGKLTTNDKKESVKLDQVLKFLFNTSNKVLVNLLNGLFEESFDENEVNITVSNNEYIEESLDVLRGDMFYTASDNQNSDKKASYHIEFQTKNDSTMVVRTFEYGFRKARDEAKDCDGIKTVYFPKQKVIFFEENSNIEESLKLKIVFLNKYSLSIISIDSISIPTKSIWAGITSRNSRLVLLIQSSDEHSFSNKS